jgi:P27 family predicted phage terminase small subunit
MKNSLPPPPRHLSKEAKVWWKRLNEKWVLDEPSLLVLEHLLEAFDRMREAQATLAEKGSYFEDRFKQWKAHPATLVERDSRQAVLRGLKALGLDLEPVLEPKGGRKPGK